MKYTKNAMKIIYLPHYDGIDKLIVKDKDDAGIDLRAAIKDSIELNPGQDVIIPTGVKIHIGSHDSHRFAESITGCGVGVYGCILPRSGLGFNHYLRLANTAGVIDAGYQGEIMIKIRNESMDSILEINRGDRICQLIFQLYVKGVEFEEVSEFESASRGDSGFGASGVL